jgi:uncharacterized protein (TIGR00730 family)
MRRVCVFCGSAEGRRPVYREAAAALGRAIAARGLGLVYGGGAVGLMGVVAEAALAAGAEVTGVIPGGLLRREVGLRSVPDLRVVDTMHERKALMAELADGFVVLPGGYGTLEEAIETLTWTQLGIHGKGLVLLDVAGYWGRLLALLDQMVEEEFLTPVNRSLALRAATPDAALDALAAFRPPPRPRWLGEEET